MDRRGFLKLAGVGGALVAAAPRLLIQPARNVVAEPERTIFVPPSAGWFESVMPELQPIDEDRIAALMGLPQWSLSIERPWKPGSDMSEGFLDYPATVPVGGVNGFLVSRAVDDWQDRAVMVTERYVGTGRPPDIHKLDNVRAKIKVEYPSDPLARFTSPDVRVR